MRGLVLLIVLLGGCTTMQKHPVAAAPPPAAQAACVDPANVPAEPPTVGQKFNGDAKHDLQILAPNALALRQWGEKLRGLLEPCLHTPAGEPARAAAVPSAKP